MIEKIAQSPAALTTDHGLAENINHLDADTNDIATFNAALGQNQNATQSNSGPLAHLAGLEADAMAKLQQLSTSLNPGDYMKTARSLSAYQLESLVTTKVIAKSTQAIEKLTSLQ